MGSMYVTQKGYCAFSCSCIYLKSAAICVDFFFGGGEVWCSCAPSSIFLVWHISGDFTAELEFPARSASSAFEMQAACRGVDRGRSLLKDVLPVCVCLCAITIWPPWASRADSQHQLADWTKAQLYTRGTGLQWKHVLHVFCMFSSDGFSDAFCLGKFEMVKKGQPSQIVHFPFPFQHLFLLFPINSTIQ